MKNIILILTVLFVGLSVAQEKSDTLRTRFQQQEQIKDRQMEMNRIQQRIGSQENPADEQISSKPRIDVFIDKDGDGICDNRQSGMSFNKLRNRKGSPGQKGPGGPKGFGGGVGNASQQHGGNSGRK